MTAAPLRTTSARLVLTALAVLALAGCGGGDENGDEPGAESAPADSTPAEGGCRSVDAPPADDTDSPPKPSELLDASETHRLVFRTSCGDFTVELDPQQAPNATASLVSLAEAGFFDDTTFHRVVPGFVIQGGDPTGTGSGGPDYSTVDPPRTNTTYTAGVVAMAKTQTDPAGTAGSQFFVVTAPDAGLPPDYAVVGRVVEGMATVRTIEALGDAQTQRPSQPIVVDEVAVERP